MDYTINWLERKTTSTGKNKIDATLDHAEGQEKGVTIWDSFPDFANLAPGKSIKGDIVVKQNGNYTNKTLYAPKVENIAKGHIGGLGGGIKAAQERKAVMIEQAQDRKNDSIAYFNSLNSAIAMISKVSPEFSDVRDEIRKWRDFFLAEWQKYEAGDSTDKRQPF